MSEILDFQQRRREADTQLAEKAGTQVSTDSILVLIRCCKPISISTAQ
jgi:hypothetical protein